MIFSVLEVYLTKNQISTKMFKKCETMSSTLFYLSESGKLFVKKKTSLTETVIELFSPLRFSVHETRRKCIGNCSTANVLCYQFWERQNYGTIQLQGTAGETLERPSR